MLGTRDESNLNLDSLLSQRHYGRSRVLCRCGDIRLLRRWPGPCRTISWSSTCSFVPLVAPGRGPGVLALSKCPIPYTVLLNPHLLDSGSTTGLHMVPGTHGSLPVRPRKPHRARRYVADDSYILTCLSGRISAMTVPGRAIMINPTSTSHILRQSFHAGHPPLPCSRLFDRINAP